MAERRPPPAYQVYASDVSAQEEFRLASLAERGLHYTMETYCWVNHRIPADLEQMARCLGLTGAEIQGARGRLIQRHFLPHPDDPAYLYNRELERQRAQMSERLDRQTEAGRRGGLASQGGRANPTQGSTQPLRQPMREPSREPLREPSRYPPRRAKGTEMKRDETKGSVEKPVYREEDTKDQQWLDDFNGPSPFDRK